MVVVGDGGNAVAVTGPPDGGVVISGAFRLVSGDNWFEGIR